MFVSVIVPHYDDLASLDRCLGRVCQQDANYDVEIIVADNASKCGLREVERVVAGRAKVVTVKLKGAGAARNGGVAEAVGQILAFTDCDCEPAASWLRNGVAALETWDVVGGKMSVSIPPRTMTSAEAFEVVFAFNNKRYVERCGFTVTANLFCSREVFAAVGGFGVGLSEDVEWCRRARASGYSLGYCPAAECHHPARASWQELKRKWTRIIKEDYALNCQGYPLGRAKFIVKALLMPASVVFHMGVILGSDRLTSWQERAGATATLLKLRLWRAWFSIRLAFGPAHAEVA